MKRLFFALWPDTKTRKQVAKFQQSIHAQSLKKVKADNLHVTLLFLGNINNKTETALKQSVENIKVSPFPLQFEQLSFWKKPRILCLTTQQYDTQLSILVKTLKQASEQCAIKTEERPYKPHITLARKAHTRIALDVPLIELHTQSFCLVESCSTPNGVSYQVLQEWDFIN